MQWRVIKVPAAGQPTALGYVVADSKAAAIVAARAKWPSQIDNTRPQSGFDVRMVPRWEYEPVWP